MFICVGFCWVSVCMGFGFFVCWFVCCLLGVYAVFSLLLTSLCVSFFLRFRFDFYLLIVFLWFFVCTFLLLLPLNFSDASVSSVSFVSSSSRVSPPGVLVALALSFPLSSPPDLRSCAYSRAVLFRLAPFVPPHTHARPSPLLSYLMLPLLSCSSPFPSLPYWFWFAFIFRP